MTTKRHYGSTGQSKHRSWFGGGASDAFDYQYDRLGNLKSQARSAAGANATESYTYDALQRLIASSGLGGSASYAYTKSGNLTQKSDYGLGANAYTYPAGKHGMTSVILPENQTATYSYDANGNLVGGNTLDACTTRASGGSYRLIRSWTTLPVAKDSIPTATSGITR
jgi:YD repeat-containing protein